MADPLLPPQIGSWLPALIILGVGVVVGWVVDRLVLRRLERFAAGTDWKMDDVLLQASRGLAWLWCVLLAVHLAGINAPVSVTDGQRELLTRLVEGGFILSITVAAMRAVGGAFATYAPALPFGGGSTILINLAKALVLLIGVLVLLQTEGISITPVLTALGVGGLAVALALQDTLGNLFAGIHILMARHLRPGDYIRIDTDFEGVVADIGWRNTTVRTMGNSLIVVPNSKLAGAMVVNHTLPEPALNLVVPVGVAYGSDLERVEAVLTEVAVEIATAHPGIALLDPPPVARFSAFQDSGINANVIIRCTDMVGSFTVRHALIKAIHARLGQEGIEIPFPTRSVRLADSAGQPLRVDLRREQ